MITLINPPSPWLINQKAFPPLGLLYLASYLEQKNFEVQVIDLSNKEDNIENGLIDNLNYELQNLEQTQSPIFITSTTPQYPYAKLINAIIKNRNPNVITVIGGAHATSEPGICLEDGFNHVVIGEGERAVVKIAEYYAIKNKIDIGKIIILDEIHNIDSIPVPNRNLINIKEYGYNIGTGLSNTGLATTILTSRGCPFNCGFCAKSTMSNKVRFHSPNYVEVELRHVIDTYGFKNFLFVDDCFTMKKDRFKELLDRIKPLEINWRCYARADQMNKEILTKMKEAGCVEIGIGIESGSQDILNTVGKHTNVIKNMQLIKDMKEIGITSNAFIVLGLPGETEETVVMTRKFMEITRPDKFGYNIFIPYTGTGIFKSFQNKQKELKQRDLKQRELKDSNMLSYDIEIYDMPTESSWSKGKEILPKSYVRTKDLSRERIETIFKEEFNYFVELTGFRPGIGKK